MARELPEGRFHRLSQPSSKGFRGPGATTPEARPLYLPLVWNEGAKEIDEMMKMVRDLLDKIRGTAGKGGNDSPEPTPIVSSEPKESSGPTPQQEAPVASGIGIEPDPV